MLKQQKYLLFAKNIYRFNESFKLLQYLDFSINLVCTVQHARHHHRLDLHN